MSKQYYMYMFILLLFIFGMSFYNEYSREHSKEGYDHYKTISNNLPSFSQVQNRYIGRKRY